jgi:hypothetical protein
MAEQTEMNEQAQAEESNGSNGSNGGHKVMQAAAIAAATGAAAFAAKKAFSARDQSAEGGQKSGSGAKSGGGGDESMIVAMASSGWSAARHSLLPFAEEAAGAAGEWVGRNGPDVVVETIVPRFITSFERTRSKSDQSE